MIIHYKINKNEIIVNFNLKSFNNFKIIYKLITKLLIKNKFYGNKIIVYLNGIYLGNFYISKFYLKKLYIGNHLTKIDSSNSYFVFNKILEINNNTLTISNIKKIINV